MWIYKLKESAYATQHKDVIGNTYSRTTTEVFFFGGGGSKPKNSEIIVRVKAVETSSLRV